MRKTIVLACVLGCLSFVGAADTAALSPTVKIKSIVEKREVSMSEDKNPFSGWNNNLEINLHIDGPSVAGARSYGHLKIKTATDDAGTNLAKKGQGPSHDMDRMEEIREPMTFGSHNNDEDKPKTTGFDVKLDLPTPSARSAKTFSVSATLDVLAGGEKKVIKIKDIKSHLGKPVHNPALKDVGVRFELVDPADKKPTGISFGGGDNSITAIISGKIENLAAVRIVNAAGKKLNNSSSWSDSNGSRTISYMCNDAIPADAVLELEVWPGQKTVTVPIELTNIKLP